MSETKANEILKKVNESLSGLNRLNPEKIEKKSLSGISALNPDKNAEGSCQNTNNQITSEKKK